MAIGTEVVYINHNLLKEVELLKKKKNAVVLAHYYQTDEVKFVADFIGDSLELSKKAKEVQTDIIVFAGVIFMAETAKILNSTTKVLIPSLEAKCSLADSLTAQNVRKLRQKYPDAAVVAYVNTYADVKAEADICCTSANFKKVIDSLPNKRIIFVPDEYMAKNLETDKEIILWNGKCVVHEQFTPQQIKAYKQIPGLEVLVHIECSPEVATQADFAGSTSGIKNYIAKSQAKDFLILTECSMLSDLTSLYPDKNFHTPCTICPYMKQITLEGIYNSLKNEIYEIKIDEEIMHKARRSLDEMLKVG